MCDELEKLRRDEEWAIRALDRLKQRQQGNFEGKVAAADEAELRRHLEAEVELATARRMKARAAIEDHRTAHGC